MNNKMNTSPSTSILLSLEDDLYTYKLNLNEYSKALSIESIHPKKYLKQEFGSNKTLSYESIKLVMNELDYYSLKLENMKYATEEVSTLTKVLFGIIYGLAAVVGFIASVLKAIWEGIKKVFDMTFGNLFRIIKETFSKSKESLSQGVLAYLNKPVTTFVSFRDNPGEMKRFLFHFLSGDDNRISYLTAVAMIMMDVKRLQSEYSFSVLEFFTQASNVIQQRMEEERKKYW